MQDVTGYCGQPYKWYEHMADVHALLEGGVCMSTRYAPGQQHMSKRLALSGHRLDELPRSWTCSALRPYQHAAAAIIMLSIAEPAR